MHHAAVAPSSTTVRVTSPKKSNMASNATPSTTSTALGSTSAGGAPTQTYEPIRGLADIKSIRDLDEAAVRDILRHHTTDQTLEVVEMGVITDMSGLNDAFNSTICSLKVKAKFGFEESNEQQEKDFNFVIKSPPKMNFIRMVHKLSRPFFNEVSCMYLATITLLELSHLRYLDLVPQIESVDGSMAHLLPTCYHAYSSYYASSEGQGTFCTKKCPWWCWLTCKSPERGVLVLENVKLRQGRSYTMFNKRQPLPLDHVQLIFRELAHFHGKWLKWIALAKEGRLPKGEGNPHPMSFKNFESTYNTQRRIPKLLYKQLKNVAKKTVIKILKKKGGEEENIAKCRRFFDDVAMRMLSQYMRQPPGKVFTLCHGDFWSNNILFNYGDEEEASVGGEGSSTKRTPKDLILIDFQLINYGHPAYDLVYFTYLNTDLEFRDAHLKTVLRTYYDTFAPYVHEALTEDFKYSFEDFVADFEFHRPLGFTTACSVMPNVLSDCQLNLETTGCLALRELQRKQQQELEDDENPSSIEIRRRIVQMIHEMAREGVI